MGWLGTLLGGLMGFGASAMPEVISLIRAHYFHKFAMEAADKGQPPPADPSPTVPTPIAAVSFDTPMIAYTATWIDMLSNSVRPILTYLFFAMFFIIKMSALFHIVFHEHVEFLTGMQVIWDAETSSLFAAIISFWFGSRALGATAGTATLATPVRVAGIVNGDTGK